MVDGGWWMEKTIRPEFTIHHPPSTIHNSPVRFDVLTLFPDLFQGYLTQSLLKLAIQNGLVQINLWNLRDWATDKHHKVDDRPFGGGPGMVLMPEPVFAAVEAVQAMDPEPGPLILLTPAGERLTQPLVRELSGHKRLLLLCGRYEGFDERVRLGLKPREVSIGDFVCNGGEVPAMVVIDTVIRYVPGVLGDPESVTEESHSDPGQLEYPQYTRPRVFRDMAVPEVLLSGDHQAVARWRRDQSVARSAAAGWNKPTNEMKGGDRHEESTAEPGGGRGP
jgi:tRNA (guanine37-N1)-methyltransferase